jgi:ribosome-binding factor A
MTSRRQRQVAELLHEELGTLIQQKVQDPRLETVSVTVTGVEVSPDLETARVYVSVLGSDEEAEQALIGLRSATRFLRREIGATLSLRLVPQLIFKRDVSLEHGMRIDRLLDDIQSAGPAEQPDGE